MHIIDVNPSSAQDAFNDLPLNTLEVVVIRLAAGRYGDLRVPRSRYYPNRLVIQGPENQRAILTGSRSEHNVGLTIGPNTYATVENLHVRDWPRHGILTTSGSNVWMRNCRVVGCGVAGIKTDRNSEVRVEGGLVRRCEVGLEAYSCCVFTFGYREGVTVRQCEVGVRAQNASQGHVDFCDINARRAGIDLVNQSRAHVKECTVRSTHRAIQVRHCSTWFNNESDIRGDIDIDPSSSQA